MALNRSIHALLDQAQLAIVNALDNPTILSYLQKLGYTPERIRIGYQLYETLYAAQHSQRAAYGNQLSATATLKAARAIAHKTYIRHVKIARIAFKGQSGVMTQLGLNGTRQTRLAAWLAQVIQFYNNALADQQILDELKEFGITPQKLKAGLHELAAVDAASQAQQREIGNAQKATKERDDALEKLKTWLSDFVAIAKIALEEDNQLLEGLGILQRS